MILPEIPQTLRKNPGYAMKYLDASTFLSQATELPVVDVRSPGEFLKGHIPGAVSMPLFDDDERAVIGTLYKQEGRDAAVDEGLGIVGPKVQKFTRAAKELAREGRILVHCWRGGMRSEKMAMLFELIGLKCGVLEGGYKAYRKQVLEDFKEIPNLVILQGATGSGKTDILLEMAKVGEQVIDLEGLANHRGSTFGGIGMGEQPSTQQFHNDIHRALEMVDPGRRVWMEGESAAVGNCALPETLWVSMNRSRVVEVEMSRAVRVERLMEDYGDFPPELIAAGVERLAKRLGPNRMAETLEALANNEGKKVANYLLEHYDKAYRHGNDKHKVHEPVKVNCETGDPVRNAELVIKKANEIGY